ncbi:MAG: iron ABC transporter permease [Alphaproteobacteria bacterium]|nr:iron ABC transporter permease [Alphaproteobacteria bacterium]
MTFVAADGAGPSIERGTRRIRMQQGVQIALLIVLLVLVAGPLLVLLCTSFSPEGKLPFETVDFSWANYVDLFAQSATIGLIWNTLKYAGGSVVLALLLAIGIAWLTERTDMPGRTVARVLMFSWMAIPPLVFGYGWILLINPSNGVINNFLKSLLGLDESPLTPYTMTSLILISGLGLTPTAFVMLSGLLRNMDPLLENAGLVLGASRRTVTQYITLPLLRPGILSVGMFLVMTMIQAFDLPLVIGLTAQIPVMSTRIYTLASPEVGGLPNYGLAAAFGIMLLVMATLLMWGYFRSIRISERFRVVSGKGFRPRRLELGLWRYVAAAAVALYFFIMLLPMLNLLWASLFPFYRVPTLAQLFSVSLEAYQNILEESVVRRALVNTVLLVLVSATTVIVLSLLVSWYSLRGEGRLGKWLDTLSFSPIAVPPIVMAIAILLLYLKTPLYASIGILMIGHITVYVAFGTRSMISALVQIDRELENAAIISGATWLTSLRRIIVPLLWPHIVNCWLWLVAHSARDLTFPLMLMSTTNLVGASVIWMVWDYPNLPGAAALSMLLVLGLMVLVVPVQIMTARRAEREI